MKLQIEFEVLKAGYTTCIDTPIRIMFLRSVLYFLVKKMRVQQNILRRLRKTATLAMEEAKNYESENNSSPYKAGGNNEPAPRTR